MDKRQWKVEFNALCDEDQREVERLLLKRAKSTGVRPPLRDGRRRVDWLWEVRRLCKEAKTTP